MSIQYKCISCCLFSAGQDTTIHISNIYNSMSACSICWSYISFGRLWFQQCNPISLLAEGRWKYIVTFCVRRHEMFVRSQPCELQPWYVFKVASKPLLLEASGKATLLCSKKMWCWCWDKYVLMEFKNYYLINSFSNTLSLSHLFCEDPTFAQLLMFMGTSQMSPKVKTVR